MKRFLFSIILLSSFYTLNSFAQTYGWVYIGSNIPGDSLFHDLSDIYFVNDDEGWVTSSTHAEIYHTTDGGETFEVQTTQFPTNAIWMLNANEGYAGGDQGRVYRTIDGGQTWNVIGSIGSTLSDIAFPPQPADTGYACGDNGAIYKVHSTDVIAMNSNAGSVNLSSVNFPTKEEGWSCGERLIIHYVNDAWTTDQSYPSNVINAIYFVDNNNGWAVGDNGRIIHTTDGQNWATQLNPNSNSLYGVFFLNINEGWTVGVNGTILHTTNGGTDWVLEGDGLVTTFLRGVHITSNISGYISGNHRTLYKIGILPSVEEADISPSAFSLSQNYPNPFNPTTKIKFEIPQTGYTSLKVYDVLGNIVTTPVNEEKPTGEFEIELNGTELTSGIYFYQLRTENFLETKKMILMK